MESNNKIKIGYSKNCLKRLKQFKTGNPDIILVDIKIGTREDEAFLHKECKNWNIGLEWFEKNSSVLQIWNHYDPWKSMACKKLLYETKLFSTILLTDLCNPADKDFVISGYSDTLIKVNEAKANGINIPNEIEEAVKVAKQLLDIYNIGRYLSFPNYKLPEDTELKLKYKLYDNVYKAPYLIIYNKEATYIDKQINVLKIANKFEQLFIRNFDKFSESDQLIVQENVNSIELEICKLEILQEHYIDINRRLKKILRED